MNKKQPTRYYLADDAIALPMAARTMAGAPVAEMAADSSATVSKSYSETNVQVAGVDEADIVKTDGTYVYIVRNQEVTIVRAHPSHTMEVVSRLVLSNENFHPQELYIDNGKLIVIGNEYTRYDVPVYHQKTAVVDSIWPGPSRGTARTVVRIYDVSDVTNPSLIRSLSFDGNKVSSRRIGDRLFLVMNQGLRWWRPIPLIQARDEGLLPHYSDSAQGSEDYPVVRCADVQILPHVMSPQYLIVTSIPIDDSKGTIHAETILGNGQNIYSSLNNIYVANTRWNYSWRGGAGSSNQKTDVYRFKIKDDGIAFSAKGDVPGHILNQFSMDEHNGHFRIANDQRAGVGSEYSIHQ